MIPPLLEHSLIRIQTLREAPSGPHVQGLGKHVYLDKSPKDTHCWKELFVFTALETWKCQFDRHCYWPFYTEWLAELVDIFVPFLKSVIQEIIYLSKNNIRSINQLKAIVPFVKTSIYSGLVPSRPIVWWSPWFFANCHDNEVDLFVFTFTFTAFEVPRER